MSKGRTFPTGVGAPILLDGLQVIGRVRPLSVIHRFQALLLIAAAAELNGRPRKTLGWDSPAQRLAMLLSSGS